MSGKDRQPSSLSWISSLDSRSSGSMNATGRAFSVSPASLGSTMNILRLSPIWSDAMPRPFSAYIESHRSRYSSRTESSTSITSTVGSRSRASGQTTVGRTAMTVATLPFAGRPGSALTRLRRGAIHAPSRCLRGTPRPGCRPLTVSSAWSCIGPANRAGSAPPRSASPPRSTSRWCSATSKVPTSGPASARRASPARWRRGRHDGLRGRVAPRRRDRAQRAIPRGEAREDGPPTVITEDQVKAALATVIAPAFEADIVTYRILRTFEIQGDDVLVRLDIPTHANPVMLRRELQQRIEAALKPVGAKRVTVIADVNTAFTPAPSDKAVLKGPKNVVAVAAGKGGGGKSTVAVNLALALAKHGAKVGLLDADVFGPSIPTMLGSPEVPAQASKDSRNIPALMHGLRVVSVGFFVDKDEAVVW